MDEADTDDRPSHYVAVLVNPDGSVYTEVELAFVDGAPADPVRDVVTVGEQTVTTVWRPIDEPPTGHRVRYRLATGAR
ncbi:hypothetical protein [Leifsonia naganoensis]|uniref:Uncharacterized protein n=1 Tax=Leifsonia naganoensis TaxID=150025 RepID=A0A853DSN8_9MICO|nr:hypothetical protein [Leifsonia naganoensis]NYK11227.1 hypothetical protein [Leifsonia naganoensis]